MKKKCLIYICLVLLGCTTNTHTHTGDKIIAMTSAPESHESLLTIHSLIKTLYNDLRLPNKRKVLLDSIHELKLIHENKDSKFSDETAKAILIKGDVYISHCHDSIVIASGNINISHGSNNILISGKNIKIAHDQGGSLVVAREKAGITFANNTTIYAPAGLKIGHSSNVISYNSNNQTLSWGHVDNILIDSLFALKKPHE